MTEATLALSQLPLGKVAVVDLAGEPVAVAHTAEGIFAIADTCSHAEVSLAEGELSGCLLECWMHGSAFDLRTGEPTTPPAIRPVETFNVKVVGSGADAVIHVTPKEAA